ncbi:hypothetical protein EV182_002086 [Spiromyces aspiralis]|uniref:Uncharacterized protein n=1 Tax=Spiromyces aspiralis TaxID=68401 RepID=A0ACC1HI34_9FUNG|nr:hypothetical protein EV182_002086 [Spiromyces aspiralis]
MLSALSYAEFASMFSVSGSTYTYTFTTLGELAAWMVSWDLILEFLIGSAAVAVGWSSYITRLFADAFNVSLPISVTTSPVRWNNRANRFEIVSGAIINIPAILVIILLTSVLVLGTKQSARLNTVVTIAKILVIIIFIFASIKYIDRANYVPFVPPQTGGEYGVLGIFKGAQQMFFAYLGFDAISTAAQEAKHPQRDIPIAIIVSLLVSITCYSSVSVILTGLAPYDSLNTPSPISTALTGHPNTRWIRIIVDLGIIAGLTTVVMILLMAQSRMFLSVAGDGLLPHFFRRVNRRFQTPIHSQIAIGAVSAVCAGFLPIDILGDLTSLATILAFLIVHVGVIIMRFSQPNAQRSFRIPGHISVPILGAAVSVLLIVLSGVQSIIRMLVWLGIGLLVYVVYGRWHSHLNDDGLSTDASEGASKSNVDDFGSADHPQDKEMSGRHSEKIPSIPHSYSHTAIITSRPKSIDISQLSASGQTKQE